MQNLPEKTGPGSEIVLYQTEDGRSRIQVRLEGETVWLTQAGLAELYQTTPQNITLHTRSIYQEGELLEEATCKEYLQVRREGNRHVQRRLKHYNLDMILAVGYRVRSHRGTQFRQWATERLREYIVKGFALDDERLQEPGGLDYFDELLERIRAIRASEKRFYQKVRDIYATSVDYDPRHPMTLEFFAAVQNMMLYAVTGRTAAEIVHDRADAEKPHMGLTTWKGAARGRRPTKADTEAAKNYLNAEEIATLNLLVTQYLDFAELQARRRRPMRMADWQTRLHDFLTLNEQDILEGAGRISAKIAKELAHREYAKFRKQQDAIEMDEADEELRQAARRIEHKDENE